jgi:hypothetical protein
MNTDYKDGKQFSAERIWYPDAEFLEQIRKRWEMNGLRLVGTENRRGQEGLAYFEREIPVLNEVDLVSLESGLDDGCIKTGTQETFTNLRRCGLIDQFGRFTDYGFAWILELQSLEKQCQALHLPLNKITVHKKGKVEIAALDYFKSQGYDGSFCEGGAVLLILKSLCLQKLIEVNAFNSREDACKRYLEAQLLTHYKKRSNFLEAVEQTQLPAMLENFSEIYNYVSVQEAYPGLTTNIIEGLYSAIGVEKLSAILWVLSEEPYLYRKGWPDLTLFGNGAVRFVEIKQKDNLHMSQITTISAIREATSLDFSVAVANRNHKAREESIEFDFAKE